MAGAPPYGCRFAGRKLVVGNETAEHVRYFFEIGSRMEQRWRCSQSSLGNWIDESHLYTLLDNHAYTPNAITICALQNLFDDPLPWNYSGKAEQFVPSS
jgi:hypothetical protein